MNEIDTLRELGFSNKVIAEAESDLAEFSHITPDNVGAYLGIVRKLIDGWGSEANKHIFSGNKASQAVVSGIKAWEQYILHAENLPMYVFEQQSERFELARDRAKLGLVAWQLTGNEGYLNGTLNLLRDATKSELPETSSVAQLEIERLQHRSRIEYTKPLEVASSTDNWERVATIASWEVVDSLKGKQGTSLMEGIGMWWKAAKHNKRLLTFLPRQLTKAITEKVSSYIWRKTIKPENRDRLDEQMPVLLSNSPLQS